MEPRYKGEKQSARMYSPYTLIYVHTQLTLPPHGMQKKLNRSVAHRPQHVSRLQTVGGCRGAAGGGVSSPLDGNWGCSCFEQGSDEMQPPAAPANPVREPMHRLRGGVQWKQQVCLSSFGTGGAIKQFGGWGTRLLRRRGGKWGY